MTTQNYKQSSEIEEDDLEKINTFTSKMLLCLLEKFDMLTERIPNKQTCPKTRDEWTDLLLHILFEGCAMSFQAADSGLIKNEGISKGKICGLPCSRYLLGSMHDGLGCAIPGAYSDADYMNVLDGYITTEDINADSGKDTKSGTSEEGSITTKELIQLTPGSFPCYTKLKQNESSTKLIEVANSLNHGPVIRTETREELLAHTFEYDNSIAVVCDTWPEESVPWKNRHRPANWPSAPMIKRCASLPAYIVSKAHASNVDDKFEWRYSFVRQEVLLLRDISEMMKMTYIVTKFLIKQVITSDDSFSTYHMKTLMMWLCEEKTDSDFDSKSLYQNVIEYLSFILENIEKKSIKHYFIPENNMIAHLTSETVLDISNKIQTLRKNVLGCLKNSYLATRYLFEIATLAKLIDESPANDQHTFMKCQSVCLEIVIEYLMNPDRPHFRCVWACAKYVLPSDERYTILDMCKLLMTSTSKATSIMTDKLFGSAYKALLILGLTLYEELRSDVPLFAQLKLHEFVNVEEDNTQLEHCIGDVFRLIGTHSHAKTTRILCYVIYETVKTRNIQRSIATQALRSFADKISVPEKNECNYVYLLYRFKEITSLLQLPESEIEVLTATLLRLWGPNHNLEIIETICDIFEGVSFNSVLKQLVYAIFLYTESETIENEVNSQWLLMKKILSIKRIPSTICVFQFVSAVCIFQKLDNHRDTEVEAFLKNLEEFGFCKKYATVSEMKATFDELMKPETLDFNQLFNVLCCYANDCMENIGVSFAVSVMDETLKPHHNLGVLAAVGMSLSSTEEVDKAIEVLELWTKRYIQANVEQNPLLIVKTFGKLGHLYHTKCNLETEGQRSYDTKAAMMFQLAFKEPITDLSVMTDYILYVRQYSPELVQSSIKMALTSEDKINVSSYFKNALSAFQGKELTDLREMIESTDSVQISSSVLAHYLHIVLSHDLSQATCVESVQKMEEIVTDMETMLKEMEAKGDDCNNQKNIIEWSRLLVAKAQTKAKNTAQTCKINTLK